jgi:phosphoglucosamine mutase
VGTLFGTDGVRGVANADLTPELAFRLGRASTSHISQGYLSPQIVVGKDTRISGDMLEAAYIAGATSAGGTILRTGIVPTPAVSFLTRSLACHAGIMISASHNPIEDNGIKIFSSQGFKLPDDEEDRIEELLIASEDLLPRPIGGEIGRVRDIADAEALYGEHIKSSVGAPLQGLKVVLDCAYGASFRIAPAVFRELGAEVIALHDEPEGLKINVQCGSTNPTALKKVTLSEGAHLGLAFDGDADRCLAVDERGQFVDGDQLLTIFTGYFLDHGLLPSKILVATVMSNLGLEHAMQERGIRLLRTKVGDRYVLEEMKRVGANLGGEQSGHIILLDYNTTGDGLATAVLLARIVKEAAKPLSALAGQMKHMPQLLVNVRARNKDRLSQDQEVGEAIAEMEEYLKDRGRILVRPSGTEPLIRVMAEGPDEEELKRVVGKLTRVIEEKLG